MNVADLLKEAAADRASHTAFQFEGRAWSYAELDRVTDRCANAFVTLGVGEGIVVAIFLESGPELLIAYLGALKCGAVPNVVNAMLKPEEVRNVVVDSEARLLITDPARWDEIATVRDELGTHAVLMTGDDTPPAGTSSFEAALVEASDEFDVVDTPPEALANLLYTSGTTGRPKGVMLSHRNVLDNARQFSRIHYGPDDRLLIGAPLFHCWGLINGVLGTFASRGTAIVVRRYRTEPVLDLIEEARPTIFMGVPTMINYMSKSPAIGRRDLSSLNSVLCAAAPMPLELIDVLRDHWKVGYAESYGLTETSPVITTTHHSDTKPGSCGKAMGDTVLKVTDPEGNALPCGAAGELWAWGTAISGGYYRRPDATEAVFTSDGWFRTGDIAKIDECGYVAIVDRLKDMINVGGMKVCPRDVEEVLHRHPAIADAVVLGTPDADRGEVVKAFIALKEGQSLTPDDALEFLRPSLAAYKLPRSFEFVDAIPRSPSGKALRRLLR